MKPRDFLDVAYDLAAGEKEAHWRSAVSRAYYADFHAATILLRSCGFAVPQTDQGHSYLWLRLSNCGHPDLARAGKEMIYLRNKRNWADYDFESEMDQGVAFGFVQMAETIIQVLEQAAAEPIIRTTITDAMKVYERDVLRHVTWHS